MKTLTLALILIFFIRKSFSSHFRGGVITWRSVEETATSVVVEFTCYWSWRNDFSAATFCDDSTIQSGNLMGINDPIICDVGCASLTTKLTTTTNAKSTTTKSTTTTTTKKPTTSTTTLATKSTTPGLSNLAIGDTQMYCNAYSVDENWSRGDRTFNFTFPKGGYYEVRYYGNQWVALNQGGGSWEVRTTLDLSARPDNGRINTSPVTQVPQFITLRKGLNYSFKIPTYDADGDFVRCRYALAANNECGGVCIDPKISPIAINPYTCELSFKGGTAITGYYAISLMLEDYITNSSMAPLSSVPLQLLVEVVDVNTTCTTK